ncbi:MAG: acylase [Planctomycetota bacterium]|jgi:acyl-homoserine-lactone acylase
MIQRLRTLALAICCVALLSPAFGCKAPKPTEILWDTWGVPHIYADSDAEIFRALGWAQMHSHGDLLLKFYGQARGRAAEYWGDFNLESDRWVRTNGIPERAIQWYNAQTPEFRKCLDAFADGINAYAAEHEERITEELRCVLPVRARDVLAHTQNMIHFTFLTSPRSVAMATSALPRGGSNAWAIAPSRTENGHAMLLMNPHLRWSEQYTWYEAHLNGPGRNFYGAFFVGFPTPLMGFNDRAGFATTVNPLDGADLYELTLRDGGYAWEDSTLPFMTESQVIKVKEDNGFKEVPLTIQRSVHGPVVKSSGNSALALRVTSLDQPEMLKECWDLTAARDLEAFETVLERLQLPFLNLLYADAEGHIFYLFNGRVPKRPKGDYAFWSEGLVAGDDPSLLWKETHPYEDLPRVVDPASGWLQNANDPPWFCTVPPVLKPEDFPPYLAPQGMQFRAQQSARMLLGAEKLSFEDVIALKHNTRMLLADRILDDLIPAAREHGGELALKAADVLEAWDRRADAESRGAALFFNWMQMVGMNPFAVPWSADAPLDTPDGLADPQAAAAALEQAAHSIYHLHKAFDPAFGEDFRFRLGDWDLPGHGGPGDPFGIFRTVYFWSDTDRKFRAVAGDSFYAIVEFSDPPRARVLTCYGNSSRPGSPHFGDQMGLFAEKKMRPAWLSRKEIEANLEFREDLSQNQAEQEQANSQSSP